MKTHPPLTVRGRVLFADDDDLARDGLAAVLEREGFVCTCAASGTEAAEKLRHAEFDVLLSDIDMPGNADLELIETIPQLASGLPVVLLTGRPSIDTAARSVRLAVTAYLTKPPEMPELVSILDQAVAAFRNYRAMRTSRERLHYWDQELARIEQELRRAPEAGAAMDNYLRLMLRQIILMLSDLERATQATDTNTSPSRAQVEHVAALRHAVDVLERTKQSFKSKELADLRKLLEQLLARG